MGLRAYLDELKSSKVLMLVLGLQAAIIVIRVINLYVTGFMTSDEVNYILDVMLGQPYGDRWFFNDQLVFLFKFFSIDSIPRFMVFFPFYLVAWTFSFLILAYKTVSLVTENRHARDFAILSTFSAVSYSLLSVGLLSEGPGLTMCMLGIYAWLRYAKGRGKWYYVAISSAAFVAAAESREPYVIFPAVAALAWITLAVTRRVPIRHTLIFVAIALIVVAPQSTYYGVSGALMGVPSSVQTQTVHTVTSMTGVVVTTTQTHTTTTVFNNTTTTITGVTTFTSTTTSSVVTTHVEQIGLLQGWAMVMGSSVTLFFVGLVLGWGPVLFVISLIAFFLVFRTKPKRQIPWLMLLIALVSLGTFYGSVFTFYYEFHFYLTQGLSNLIRLTNTAIPAYLLLSTILYEKLSTRRLKILAAILIAFTVGSAGFYVTAVQTNLQLPYNVLSFNNVESPLAARNYLAQNASSSNPTIVFLTPGWEGAQLYLLGIPGIVMYPSNNIIASTQYLDFQNSSYTEALFLKLHPTVFYVLSIHDLSVWNQSLPLKQNVLILQGFSSIFLLKTYGLLFHADTSALQSTPYKIDSVQIVFTSPTGHLLKVHVSWDGS